jgi:ABC-type multidrug transport system fused ATPase/permease subunit
VTSRGGTTRAAWRIAGEGIRGLAAVSAALLAIERVLFVLTALELSTSSFLTSAAIAAGIGVLAVFRSLARSAMARRARTSFHMGAVRALLAGDVLAASALPDEDTQNAVLQGVDAGEHLVTEHLPDSAGELVGAIGVGALLWSHAEPRAMAISAVALSLGILVVGLARRFTQRQVERGWEMYVPVMDKMIDLFRGRLEIVAHGLDDRFREDFGRILERYARVSARAERTLAVAGRAPLIAVMVAVGLSLAIDASLRGLSGMTALEQAAILASAMPTFAGLASSLQSVVRASAQLEPLAEVIARARRDEGGRGEVPALPAAVRWENVSFAYAGAGADALRDLSIAWGPGQILTLTGPNGSGKSTCLRLLLGVARPRAGRVSIGGADLAEVDLKALRARVAYLPQAPCLPERASVESAMRLVAPDAPESALRAALERVGVWSVLAARAPEAPLSVRASELSSGQRQRVALARVLARDAALVLLDEPDANLDAEGIALVSQIVEELARTRMVAVAAHTPELAAIGDVQVRLGIVPRAA